MMCFFDPASATLYCQTEDIMKIYHDMTVPEKILKDKLEHLNYIACVILLRDTSLFDTNLYSISILNTTENNTLNQYPKRLIWEF